MTKKPTSQELERFQGVLREALRVLSGDVRALEAGALGGGPHGADSRADDEGEAYMQELSLDLLQHDEGTLREVIEALDRIGKGTFGRCEACSRWIRKLRLKAVPYARKCIDCQTKEEQA